MNINTLYTQTSAGDDHARRELFKHLAVRLRYVAHQRIWNASDAEDVAQEALLAISREFQSLEVTVSFSAWAHKVLDNRILAYIKAKKSRECVLSSTPPDDAIAGPGGEMTELRTRLLECLELILASNRRYARILNLHYQGFTTEEVCQKLNMKANHAYVTLFRARSMLQNCLEGREVTADE